MSKGFHITSLCRNDIIQTIEDRGIGDELERVMLIRKVKKITDDEMKWFASKLSDNFCDCCFWDNVEYHFLGLVKEKNRR